VHFAAQNGSGHFIAITVTLYHCPDEVQLFAEIIAAVAQQQVQSEGEPLAPAESSFLGLR
jgi:hypothetical protein